jgi:hypothetical protein
MSASGSILRRRPRTRAVALAVAALLGAAGSLLASTNASANLTGSSFEGGDGNMVVTTTGNTDWANVSGRNVGIDTPSGGGDNAFGQGTKEDVSAVTVVDGSIPPNKNDLTRFYEASSQGANGHIYLDLAWERLVNIGNANLDFEISQNRTIGFTAASVGPVALNRTAGDLLVNYDFGGSGTPTLGINFWLTALAGNTAGQCFSANALPCWGRHATLSASSAEGLVNGGTIVEAVAGGNLGTGLFGEAAIDLTAAGVFPAGVCQAFGSVFLKSRSSSSFTAELKDFIAPVNINISNCSTITIHKVTENGDSSFGYTTSGGLTPSTFSLGNGGIRTYSNVNAGTYSVTENLTAAQTTAGWTLKTLTCTASGTGTTATPSGSTVNITLGFNANVDCTYTNHLKAQPTASTAQSLIPNDAFTLSGATATAGGTVTMSLYSPTDATCSGTAALTQIVNVGGNGTYNTTNTTFVASTEGTWRWLSVYTGDTNNFGVTSACGVERFTIANS